ncbi:hypothetical protein ACOSP7_005687 [Xanthoceras sorbifolium]
MVFLNSRFFLGFVIGGGFRTRRGRRPRLPPQKKAVEDLLKLRNSPASLTSSTHNSSHILSEEISTKNKNTDSFTHPQKHYHTMQIWKTQKTNRHWENKTNRGFSRKVKEKKKM